jgi:signal transduction histidine kinase
MTGDTVQVLLIEDSLADARLIQEMLAEVSSPAFAVYRFDRLARGLHSLTAAPPDCILLDLNLPDSRGADTVDAALAAGRDTPVIVLTGLDDEQVALDALQRGAQDYLVKSQLDAQLLVRSILYSLQRKHAEQAIHRTHEQLIQARRMQSLLKLTQAAAGEVNNLLTILLCAAPLIDENDDPDRRRWLEAIQSATRRSADLVGLFLRFGGEQPSSARPVDIAQVVSNMGQALPALVGQHCRLEVQLEDNTWPVRAHRGQLEAALLNLLTNAGQASNHGAAVRLRVANAQLCEQRVIDTGQLPAGRYVLVDVTDEGTGMDDDVRRRAFEPFFSLRAEGESEGVGLGLSTVEQLLKDTGGYVDVHSLPGEGTSFQLYLPVCETPFPSPPAASQPPADNMLEAVQVLLAETDPTLRGILSDVLTGAGAEVVGHDDPETACRAARRNQADLLIAQADTRAQAIQILDRARGLDGPALPVLLLTGLDRAGELADEDLPAASGLLSKPFSADDLLSMTGQCLRKRGASAER